MSRNIVKDFASSSNAEDFFQRWSLQNESLNERHAILVKGSNSRSQLIHRLIISGVAWLVPLGLLILVIKYVHHGECWAVILIGTSLYVSVLPAAHYISEYRQAKDNLAWLSYQLNTPIVPNIVLTVQSFNKRVRGFANYLELWHSLNGKPKGTALTTLNRKWSDVLDQRRKVKGLLDFYEKTKNLTAEKLVEMDSALLDDLVPLDMQIVTEDMHLLSERLRAELDTGYLQSRKLTKKLQQTQLGKEMENKDSIIECPNSPTLRHKWKSSIFNNVYDKDAICGICGEEGPVVMHKYSKSERRQENGDV